MDEKDFLDIWRNTLSIIRQNNPGSNSFYAAYVSEGDYPEWKRRGFSSWDSWESQNVAVGGFQAVMKEQNFLMIYYPVRPDDFSGWMERNEITDYPANLGIVNTKVFEEKVRPYVGRCAEFMKQILGFKKGVFLSFGTPTGIIDLDFRDGIPEEKLIWILEMTALGFICDRMDLIISYQAARGTLEYYGIDFQNGDAKPIPVSVMKDRMKSHPLFLKDPSLFSFGEIMI